MSPSQNGRSLAPWTHPSRWRAAPLAALALLLSSAATPGFAQDAAPMLAVLPLAPLQVEQPVADLLGDVASGSVSQFGLPLLASELLDFGDCEELACRLEQAAERGASHALSGSLGLLGSTYVVNLKLMSVDGTLISASTTDCPGCGEGSLPGLMQEAIGGLLFSGGLLDNSEEGQGLLSSFGHEESLMEGPPGELPSELEPIQLAPTARASTFFDGDAIRVEQLSGYEQDGLSLAAVIASSSALGCLEPGDTVDLLVGLQYRNYSDQELPLEGWLSASVRAGENDVATTKQELSLLVPAPSVDDDSGGIGLVELPLAVPIDSGVPLEIEVHFDERLLLSATSAPPLRSARAREVFIARPGELPEATVVDGQEVQAPVAHILLERIRPQIPAELTVRLEQRQPWWPDRTITEARHQIPAGGPPEVHLQLPLAADVEPESWQLELWVNGCRIY